MRPRVPPGRLQRGVAAVELALILAFGLFLVPSVVVLGRIFWTYTALQKATHDAARYMAAVSVVDITNYDKAQVAIAVAQRMVAQAAAAAHISPALPAGAVAVWCDGEVCGSNTIPPVLIRVSASRPLYDQLNDVNHQLFSGAVTVSAVAVVHYAN
jgi:Flp pilus assembly protein TadG